MQAKNIFIYNLNQNYNREFLIMNSKNYDNFFVINSFDSISNKEIVRLLSKNHKLIINDESVISLKKLSNLIKEIKEEDLTILNNLFISRECYIKTSADVEYYDLLKDLQFNNDFDENSVIYADAKIGTGIKINDLISKKIFDKLNQSAFIKNLLLKEFDLPLIDVNQTIAEILKTIKFISSSLIPSTSIFLEQMSNTLKFVNFVDEKHIHFFDSELVKKIGIINAIEYDETTNAELDIITKSRLKIHDYKKFGWVDLIKIKKQIKKLNIKEVEIVNIEKYDSLQEINVCVKYLVDNKITEQFLKDKTNKKVKPIFSTFKGWKIDTKKIQDENEVPIELIFFLGEIKNLLEVESISTKLENLEIRI